MKQEKSKKKGIIIAGISAIVLIVTLSISFAFWTYSRTTDNQVLVTGDVYMKYTEGNQLVIKNALPSKEPGEKDYFEFKITGKNTYSKPIWYEIVLNHGVENPEGRTERLLDKFLKFRLVETKDGVDKTVVDNASYEDITSKKIWVNTIPANTPDNIVITYKLYMWISFNTKIGNTAGNDYDMNTWNDEVYASVRVSVNGDFEEKEITNEKLLVDEVETKLVKYEESNKEDFSGGLVAVNTEGELYNENSDKEIREYRYSGANVDNYVTFNNETWRIIGVFKEGNEEFVKIVRNEVLPENMLPSSYITNNTTYNLKSSKGETSNSVYWNYPTELNGRNYNDWTTAGLQYYLNSENDGNGNNGYLSYLDETSKNMIRDTTYYLGNFDYIENFITFALGSDYVSDSSIAAYKHERENTICSSIKDKTSYGLNGGERYPCAVWYNNKTSWDGKIGLMYGSDVGFSLNSDSWNKHLFGRRGENDGHNNDGTSIAGETYYGNSIQSSDIEKSWLFKTTNHTNLEWLISPSSITKKAVTYWNKIGEVPAEEFIVIDDYFKKFNEPLYTDGTIDYSMTIRPTLYLKSNVEVESGTGKETEPYKIILPND